MLFATVKSKVKGFFARWYRDSVGVEQNTTEAEYWRERAGLHERFEHRDFYENAPKSET